MPKQYVICGRLLPPITTRRITVLLGTVFVFAMFSVMVTLPNAVPTGPSLSKFADHKFSISQFRNGVSSSSSAWARKWPNALNPFRPKSHAPPMQKSDTHGGSSWFSDWKWLSTPFSSSFTLDENRSLLPPLDTRPPIYCYYDTTLERDAKVKEAEHGLLLTWRRAWWAQGFKPVILGPGEAMANPRYEVTQRLEMLPEARTDLMRWLAWENMGGGLLAQHVLLPMGPRDDALLTFLRRGEYPTLTRYKGLGDGLYAGSKPDIGQALTLAQSNPELGKAKSFLEALPPYELAIKIAQSLDGNSDKDADDDKDNDLKQKSKDFPFTVDNTPSSLAYYDASTVAKKYAKVANAITSNPGEGLEQLNQLINAHLHVAWQNQFTEGIAVLKPEPKHTTHLVAPAVEIAQRLAQCLQTPMESTCPPNMPRCEPCVARHPMGIFTPPTYRNDTHMFTIGTVPHPYTFQSLAQNGAVLDVPWIRRKSKRDAWLFAVTKELLGTGISGAPRVVEFKRAVASPYGLQRNLWLSAEDPVPDDVEWILGFSVPGIGQGMSTGHSPTPVPGPERLPQPKVNKDDGPVATPEELVEEQKIFDRAKIVSTTNPRDKKVVAQRSALEAWNLADTEAWRFARAYLARMHVERAAWEKEESKYAGGVGTQKGR